MKAEKHLEMFTAMLGLILTDRDAVLAGLALALTDKDLNGTVVAEMFKKSAEELGISQNELERAVNATLQVNELLGEDDNVAQSY